MEEYAKQVAVDQTFRQMFYQHRDLFERFRAFKHTAFVPQRAACTCANSGTSHGDYCTQAAAQYLSYNFDLWGLSLGRGYLTNLLWGEAGPIVRNENYFKAWLRSLSCEALSTLIEYERVTYKTFLDEHLAVLCAEIQEEEQYCLSNRKRNELIFQKRDEHLALCWLKFMNRLLQPDYRLQPEYSDYLLQSGPPLQPESLRTYDRPPDDQEKFLIDLHMRTKPRSMAWVRDNDPLQEQIEWNLHKGKQRLGEQEGRPLPPYRPQKPTVHQQVIRFNPQTFNPNAAVNQHQAQQRLWLFSVPQGPVVHRQVTANYPPTLNPHVIAKRHENAAPRQVIWNPFDDDEDPVPDHHRHPTRQHITSENIPAALPHTITNQEDPARVQGPAAPPADSHAQPVSNKDAEAAGPSRPALHAPPSALSKKSSKPEMVQIAPASWTATASSGPTPHTPGRATPSSRTTPPEASGYQQLEQKRDEARQIHKAMVDGEEHHAV